MTTDNNQLRLISAAETARMFDVTVRTIRNWENDGKFAKSVLVNKRRYYPADEVAQWRAML
jgi:DNA-binding transcriptional MerR regulator